MWLPKPQVRSAAAWSRTPCLRWAPPSRPRSAQPPGHLLGEVVATAGLVLLIFALARHLPRRPRRAGGGRLHRSCVLVHVLDLVRESGSDGGPRLQRHLRRHRTGLSSRLRSGAADRRSNRNWPSPHPVPGRGPHRGRRRPGAQCRNRPLLALAGGRTMPPPPKANLRRGRFRPVPPLQYIDVYQYQGIMGT